MSDYLSKGNRDGLFGRRGTGFIYASIAIAIALFHASGLNAAQSVTLAWDPNSETNLAGYRLYYGVASRAYSGTVQVAAPSTTSSVTNLQEGSTYYFAVTAFTTDGLESDFSAEVSYTIPGGTLNSPPVATAATIQVTEDQSKPITLQGSDANGDSLTYTVVSGPSSGTLSGSAPTLSYSPNANFFGSDSFTFRVSDGKTNSAIATVSLVVNSVNDAPTLNAVANLSLPLNSSAQVVALAGISSGAANEIQALTVTATSSNPSLIPNPAVSYTSPSSTATLTVVPVANVSGTASITVTVSDGQAQNSSVTRVFTVTVAANQSPTLASISNMAVNEDAGLQTVSLSGIGAGGTENQTLTVTASSSNTGVIPNPQVTYTSPNATATLRFTPVPNASGSANITVVVNDGQALNNTVSRVFTVTVSPVNDQPTLNTLANLVLDEDVGAQSVALSGIGSGAANESQTLVVTAASSNQSLVSNPTVSYSSPNTTGTLTFTPAANASGSATITVTVNDGQTTNNLLVRSFVVTVNPVNDTPTLDPIANLTVAQNAAAQTVALSGIGTGAANESEVLTVTASSSNPSVIASPTVSYQNGQSSGLLTITPVLNASGSSVITVTVNDGQTRNSTVTRTFTVNVLAGNLPPTLNPIADVTVDEDVANYLVNFSGVSAGGSGESQVLTARAVSSNPSVIPNPTVTYSSPVSGGYLQFSPVRNAFGSAVISVTIDDGQPTNNLVTRSFTVVVRPVNDSPTLDAITSVTVQEDAPEQVVNFTGASTGATNETQVLTITAVSSAPQIMPHPTVLYTNGTSSGTLVFKPNANAVGTATITVTVNDGGTDRNTVSRTFNITVLEVNDAPLLSHIPDQSVDLNSSTGPVPFTVTDPDTSPSNLKFNVGSSDLTLLPLSGINLGGSGTNRTVTINPAANRWGSAVVTLFVSDGLLATSNSFTVAVAAGNQAPVISTISNQVIEASTALTNVDFEVADAETPSEQLAVYGVSFNKTVIPDENIVVSGTGNKRRLDVTPAPGKSGVVSIALLVSDGSRQGQTTFEITVLAPKSKLTVRKKGTGKVNPDLNGQELTIGEAYTLTAEPDPGQMFREWGGGVAGTSPKLTFIMESNLVIEANFIPDPYIASEGTYYGLMMESDEVRHERSGSFQVTTTSRGTYTGKIVFGGRKYAVKGRLDMEGKATNVVTRAGLSPIRFEWAVGLNADVGRIAGRVTDGAWNASVLGDRHHSVLTTTGSFSAGTYTLIVPVIDAGTGAGAGSANLRGDGYGTVKVDARGMVTFAGIMGDGTKATQKVGVSPGGNWPFYLAMYKGAGSALGWLVLTNEGDAELSGLVSWIKPSMPGKYYVGGFTNEARVTGTTFLPITPSQQQGVIRKYLTCQGAGLSQEVTTEMTLLPNGKVSGQQGPKMTFSLSPTTGLFKGAVAHPETGKPMPFSGVLLQKWNIGSGILLGADSVGRVDFWED